MCRKGSFEIKDGVMSKDILYVSGECMLLGFSLVTTKIWSDGH